MNRQQLLSRLTGHHRVIYSSGHWDAWQVPSPDWSRSPWLGRFRVVDGVTIDDVPGALVCPTRAELLRSAVIRSSAWRLRWKTRSNGQGHACAYLFHPRFWPYVRHLGAEAVVYHAYDDFALQKGWTTTLDSWQDSLLRRADLVVASSDVIADALRMRGDRDIHVIPNGVDYDRFVDGAGSAEPGDLAAIPRPRICYCGAISRKLDFDVLEAIATQRPEWQLILIGHDGAVDAHQVPRLAGLRSFRNVHFLGFKTVQSLPAYLAHMDVNIMCYSMRDAPWTRAGFPLKLFEYLAAGPPVVAAPLDTLQAYADVIRLAEGPQEWLLALEAALDDVTGQQRDRRQSIAAANTWDMRAEQVNSLLLRLKTEGPDRP